jgi:hypothetical protein
MSHSRYVVCICQVRNKEEKLLVYLEEMKCRIISVEIQLHSYLPSRWQNSTKKRKNTKIVRKLSYSIRKLISSSES